VEQNMELNIKDKKFNHEYLKYIINDINDIDNRLNNLENFDKNTKSGMPEFGRISHCFIEMMLEYALKNQNDYKDCIDINRIQSDLKLFYLFKSIIKSTKKILKKTNHSLNNVCNGIYDDALLIFDSIQKIKK
jgi:hypothetical protein